MMDNQNFTPSGYEALRQSTAFLDLRSRGLLRVEGEDRARLLHAMSTNDIQNLPSGEGVYAFFLTAQGRILGDVNVLNTGSFLLLDTEPELGAKLHAHLDKYIIADDVELTNLTDTWAVFGLEGPEALDKAAQLGVPIPSQDLAVLAIDAGFVARLSVTGLPGLRLFVDASQSSGWLQRFEAAGIPLASDDCVKTVRLEMATPRYGDDISERYLVQETGVMRAVHPRKGCYLGQEIVERVRSRAQVHRHLRSLGIASSAVPTVGAKLKLQDKEVGEVTSAAYSPALQEVVALAYVRTEAIESSENLSLAGGDGPVLAHLRSDHTR